MLAASEIEAIYRVYYWGLNGASSCSEALVWCKESMRGVSHSRMQCWPEARPAIGAAPGLSGTQCERVWNGGQVARRMIEVGRDMVDVVIGPAAVETKALRQQRGLGEGFQQLRA